MSEKMQYNDLRDFISKMQEMGEVKVIEGADVKWEIGAIYEIMAERPDHPIVLFDKVNGYPAGFRVATHVVTTPRRTALAYGIPPSLSKVEMIKFWRDNIRQYKPIPPVEVDHGPVLENVLEEDKVNMKLFPAPVWHELDGGPYIGTADAVITKDPNKNWINIGCYRVQVHDERTLGILMHPGKHGELMREEYWANGKSCPVVMSFGPDPRIYLAATWTLPYGESEYGFAGSFYGRPVEVIKGKYTGLPFPADSEIVIEGEIPPLQKESRIEGPFGEWTGYYAQGAHVEPIVKVKRVLYRNNPIIFGSPPVRPLTSSHFGLPFNAAAIWAKLEQTGVPDVQGVWVHSFHGGGGGGCPFAVVSIKQRYSGHARQAGLAVAGSSSGGFQNNYVIVVDDDIDPSNAAEVIWALAFRSDPATSISIIPSTWSSLLDPRLLPEKRQQNDATNSKALIFAVKPFHWKDKYPRECAFSKDVKAKYAAKWAKPLGLEH